MINSIMHTYMYFFLCYFCHFNNCIIIILLYMFEGENWSFGGRRGIPKTLSTMIYSL